MAAGWNVQVTTFDSAGKPGMVRHFLACESDREKAVELVRNKAIVHKGERAEAVAEVPERVFIGQGMKPGGVRQYDVKTSQAPPRFQPGR
jgi:hypothetical protein